MGVSDLLRSLLQAIFRQRAIMWTVVAGVLVAAGAASTLLPPVWRATALIGTPQDFGETTGIGLLASHDLHRQVVARIGATILYPGLDDEAAADAFSRDLNAFQRQEDSVEITFDNRDPAVAARALAITLDVLGEQRARVLEESGRGALDQQEAAYKRALAEAHRRLDDYRQRNRVWSGEEERRQFLAQRGEMAGDLQRTLNSQNELAARMRSLKNQMAQVPSTVMPEQPTDHYKVVDDAKARLLELQLKEQELLSKYREDSQFVTTVREEIGRVKTFINEMTASMNQRNKPASNDLYVELSKELVRAETQMNSLDGRRAALETQLAQMDQHMEEMNNSDHELRGLQQAVADGEANLRRIEEARVSQTVGAAAQGIGLSVIQAPHPPIHPIQPNPRLYFALALPLGLLGGIAAAAMAEALSGSFGTPADVERRLGLPVLAALPLKP